MGKILNYILGYLKRILIITFLNFIIVSIVYLIKNQFTLFNLGRGLFIGGLALSLIGGFAVIGSGRTSEIDARNNYITGYDQDKFSKNFIKSRNQNINFSLLLALSGALSIVIGCILQ
jgi:hypothetical protein